MIALVMWMGIISTLFLYLLQQQRDRFIAQVKLRQHYLQQKNQVLSALQWGMSQPWQNLLQQWQCQQFKTFRTCLYLQEKRGVLQGTSQQSAIFQRIYFYQWVQWQTDKQQRLWLMPESQGWSDLCPWPVCPQ